MCKNCHVSRGITGKFFSSGGGGGGAKVIFPGVKCFFPAANFHFGRPKTNSVVLKSEKQNNKKSPLLIFLTFPPSI